jgi:putative copper export protein
MVTEQKVTILLPLNKMESLIQTSLFSLSSFLDLTGLAVLIGASWLHVWIMTSIDNDQPEPHPFQRLHRLYSVCLVILAASGIGILVMRSMEMSGSDFTTVWTVLPTALLKTHFGFMWLIRLSALISAVLLCFGGRRFIASRVYGSCLFCLGAVIAFSRSSSGHLGDYGNFSPEQLNGWLHLIAVSCLIGSLMAIAVLYPPQYAEMEEEREGLNRLADRFYILSGPLLAVLVFTGWRNSWLLVRDFTALMSSPYGWILGAKLLLFAILIVRYIVPPEHGRDKRLYVKTFINRIRFDAVLAMSILACVALLIHKVPARHQAHMALLATGYQHEGDHEYLNSEKEPVEAILITDPVVIKVGSPVNMTIMLKDQDHSPLKKLTIIHERILHAVIIGRDLKTFAHIHPEDLGPITPEMMENATFPLKYTFPGSGEYLLGIDFANDEESYSRTFRINVSAASELPAPEPDFSATKIFAGYQVSLNVSEDKIIAGTQTKLKYIIRKDNQDIVDMNPYLGAALHIAVVSADFQTFIHAHGSVPGTESSGSHLHHFKTPANFGPEIEAEIIFPSPGIYKIFAQFQHQQKVILTDFLVNVL